MTGSPELAQSLVNTYFGERNARKGNVDQPVYFRRGSYAYRIDYNCGVYNESLSISREIETENGWVENMAHLEVFYAGPTKDIYMPKLWHTSYFSQDESFKKVPEKDESLIIEDSTQEAVNKIDGILADFNNPI